MIGGILRKHERLEVRVVALELLTAGDVHQAKVKAGHLRSSLAQSFDLWIDLSQLDDREASLTIQRHNVHILVDLNGLSKGARQGVLLRQPAAVSLTFLGYPATSGGAVDMVVNDRHAAPPEYQVRVPSSCRASMPSHRIVGLNPNPKH